MDAHESYTLAVGEQLSSTIDSLGRTLDIIRTLADRVTALEEKVASQDRVIRSLSDLHV